MARNRNTSGRVTDRGTTSGTESTASRRSSGSAKTNWKAWVIIGLILLGLGAGIVGSMVGAATSF